MEVRTILWPTDLSKNSIKAAKHVSSLAEKYQAKVILLYVGVDLMSYFRAYGDPSEDQVEHFQSWELKQAKKHLEDGVCQGIESLSQYRGEAGAGRRRQRDPQDDQGGQGRHGGPHQPRPRPR